MFYLVFIHKWRWTKKTFIPLQFDSVLVSCHFVSVTFWWSYPRVRFYSLLHPFVCFPARHAPHLRRVNESLTVYLHLCFLSSLVWLVCVSHLSHLSSILCASHLSFALSVLTTFAFWTFLCLPLLLTFFWILYVLSLDHQLHLNSRLFHSPQNISGASQ